MANSVSLHRVFTAPPERLFRAFTDAEALVKWLPPHGFTGRIHQIDVRPGGGYRMSFTNLTTGHSHSFSATYGDVKPGELLRYTTRFDDPNLPGEMQVQITFRSVICGTELKISQENIPAAIPSDMCYLGWQQSLILLTQLVEPELKDG